MGPLLDLLHQLPAPLADFTGREGDLTAMVAAVDGDSVHGVTICGFWGMAGVGKTTLALVVAERLSPRYPDAQLFLDLCGTDPEPLSSAAAMARVVQAFQPSVRPPDDPVMLAAAYRSALHGKRALLLVDNAASAAQVQPLLPPPTCLFVVTSRQRFALPGQRALDLDALTIEEAREFLGRLMVGIDDATADRIATLCGRLPLALRLAGGALSQRPDLTPAEYAGRLQEAPARLQLSDGTVSVEGSIEVSWRLLAREERTLLAQLSVFPGDFDLRAAGSVWGLGEEAADSAVGRLLGTNVVEWDTSRGRYRLHDFIRDFAATRLDAGAATEASRRHATHYASVLRGANKLYMAGGDGVLQGLAIFERERWNVDTGHSWALSHAKGDQVAARLCSDYPDAGAYILHFRFHTRDRVSWLVAGLGAARSLGDRAAEESHVGNLALAYAAFGEFRRSIEFYEQSLQIVRELGERQGEGATLGNLGLAWAELGEFRRAIECYEKRLQIARELGARRGEGNALGCMGLAFLHLGKLRQAIELTEQSLAIMQELGDRRGEAIALGNLGLTHEALGERPRAVEFYERNLAIMQELGDRRGEGKALGSLGLAFLHLGKPQQAIQLIEQALAIMKEFGDRREKGAGLGNLGLAYSALDEPRRAIAFFERQLLLTQEIGHRMGEASALGNLGTAYKHLGETRRAIELTEQHLALAREIRHRRGEAIASWNLAIILEEEGDLARAVELIGILVEFERENGHVDAMKHSEQLERIQRRIASG